MNDSKLKDYIYKVMPDIDKPLEELNVPIFRRFMKASYLFVDVCIVDSSKKEELFASDILFHNIIPLINDWYFYKYGEQAREQTNNIFSGIINPFGQPTLIKIPSTVSKIEIENESSWMIFPNSVYKTETLNDMTQKPIKLDNMLPTEKEKLLAEFNEIVSLTRLINLNCISVDKLNKDTDNMLQSIWGHFEKAIGDILSFNNAEISVGCWELHLAIEKTLKVYLHQQDGKRHTGHDLNKLAEQVEIYLSDIDLSLIKKFPSGKEAVNLRYAEQIKDTSFTVDYYLKALRLVYFLTDKFDRSLSLNKNTSILLKKAPWAR